MFDKQFDEIVKGIVCEVVNDGLEQISAAKGKPVDRRQFKLRLVADVDVHPFWWALPTKPNPNLRLVREAA